MSLREELLSEKSIAFVGEATARLKAASLPTHPLAVESLVSSWRRLISQQFCGIACDLDGTLVPLVPRSNDMDARIVLELERFVDADISVAVITGRGLSAPRILRAVFARSAYSRVYCYIYNGGAMIRLDSDEPIVLGRLPDRRIGEMLRKPSIFRAGAKAVKESSLGCQVAVTLVDPSAADRVVGEIRDLLPADLLGEVAIRSSGRSVDVVPSNVSKRQSLLHFATSCGISPDAVLAIGDQGALGGNDYELLTHPYSFSVGPLSDSTESCFPVLDADGRPLLGPEGTLTLLSWCRITEARFSLI